MELASHRVILGKQIMSLEFQMLNPSVNRETVSEVEPEEEKPEEEEVKPEPEEGEEEAEPKE